MNCVFPLRSMPQLFIIYYNTKAKWKVIQFDFWVRKEQRGKGVKVVGKGKWAWEGNKQMGPLRQASHGGREKCHHPAKIPGLDYNVFL